MASLEQALENAKENFHRWDNVVFKGKDGMPPLVNVELKASTVEMFLRETGFLKALFSENPNHPENSNTNMATILYNGPKLIGMAVEYGNDEIAYHTMEIRNINELIQRNKYCDIPDWRHETEKHAHVMREFIKDKTGIEVGLVKCADLNGFFGRMVDVFARDNTLSMFLYAARTAIDVVDTGALKIYPKPKFFDYLSLAARVAPILTTQTLEKLVWKALPDMKMGVVVECSSGYACLEVNVDKWRSPTGSQSNHLNIKDWTDEIKLINDKVTGLEYVLRNLHYRENLDFAFGITMSGFEPLFKSALALDAKGTAKSMLNLARNYDSEILIYPGIGCDEVKKAARRLLKEYGKELVEQPARKLVNKTYNFFSGKQPSQNGNKRVLTPSKSHFAVECLLPFL